MPCVFRHTQVPLFINQWEAVHGLTAEQGRYEYIAAVASLAKQYDIGWAWWTWAGGPHMAHSHTVHLPLGALY